MTLPRDTRTDGPFLEALLSVAEQRSVPASTAERIADLLRGFLTEGRIAPGTRLSEESLAKALSVSRNTLREAFRLLSHEGLLVHELNRGVFVRRFTRDDVNEIYDLRQTLEVKALHSGGGPSGEDVAALRACVDEGRRAADRADWRAVGTQNLEFHRLVSSFAGSQRIDKVMRGLLAEARLASTVMTDVEPFDGPYLRRNEEICAHLEAGQIEAATQVLVDYFRQIKEQFLAADGAP